MVFSIFVIYILNEQFELPFWVQFGLIAAAIFDAGVLSASFAQVAKRTEPEPEPMPTSSRPTATTSETEHERAIRRKWEERQSYIGKENPEWESATRKLVKSRAKKNSD